MTIQQKLIRLNNKSLLLLLVFCGSFVYGQFKNFGDTTKNNRDLNYKYSVYVYGDIVREFGIGFQYQLGNKINFDVSLYNVRPNLQIKKTVKEADYFDYSGFGISFKPKFLFSRKNRLYVGANIGYEYLSHGVIFVDRSNPHIDIYSTESVKGSVYNIGFTFGNKFRYKHFLIEPFCGAGFVFNKTTAIVYSAKNNRGFGNQTFPLTYEHKDAYGLLNAGIKLGYSFKNNHKKEYAIDKKFRDVFNPKLDSLTRLFYLMEYHRPFLFEAFLKYKDLNKKALKRKGR